MSKITYLLALTILAVVQDNLAGDTELADAAGAGNWELFHKLVSDNFNDKNIWQPSFSSGNVRSLRPPPGGHVYGQSQYTFHSSSNINGKKSENSGGHRIINDDGKISEYDINPYQ